MQSIVIKCESNRLSDDVLSERLRSDAKGLEFLVRHDGEKKTIMLTDTSRAGKEKSRLQDSAAKLLARLVVEDEMDADIQRIVNTRYRGLISQEKDMVVKAAVDCLQSVLKKGRWHHFVYKRAMELLQTTDEVSLEGFIRFRLKEINRLYEMCVAEGYDRMAIEKEYQEFLKLLRNFVQMQTPMLEEVHVLRHGKGYLLLDVQLCPLSHDYLSQLSGDAGVLGMSEEDRLISLLITLAPERVIVHGKARYSANVLETICNIFDGRVILVQDSLRKN
jgi:putative sporulation protein YtxC